MIIANKKSILKQKHLFYLVVFLITLIFRFSASKSIIANNTEAEVFINLTTAVDEAGKQGSVLYQLLTIPMVKMFGGSEFILRFWIVMAGSIMVLLPLLFEDLMGVRVAVILSCLLAMDPFQIANSIQANGSTLTMLMLFSAAGFLRKQEYGIGVATLFAFILSGPNVLFGVGLSALFAIVLMINKKQNIVLEMANNVFQFCKSHFQKICVILFLSIISFIFLDIEISDVFEQMVFVITEWGQPYIAGSFPQLFPIALLAYFPIGFVSLIPLFVKNSKWKFYTQNILWVMIVLLFIAIYPGHTVMDLVWVSLPLCVLCAMKTDHVFEEFSKHPGKNHLYAALVIVVLISMVIQFSMFIYKLNYGINMINEILSLITLIIMLAMLLIFLAYGENVPIALSALKTGTMLILLFLQLAFSWRASGLNGNPAAEILWEGYFQDAQMVGQIIERADLNVVNSGLEKKVAFLDYENSAVKWAVGKDYPVQSQDFGLDEKQFAVVITEASSGSVESAVDGYYGQDFIANSYPAWTWQPVSSLVDSDFWYWLLMRQGQMIHETNYIWVNNNQF